MAAKGLGLDQESFCCSICLDLLKAPVTIPCGHSYCMSCVNAHWNREVGKQSYSCPQCRQNFTQRPVLVKNTMLALLMEEFKKSGPPAAPVSHCSCVTPPCAAAHGDVSCDFCSGSKAKAVKSCLQCLVSYCKEHLQPHYDVAALKKHKLVEPTENLQDNICSGHDEVMKFFCRTDQQCICYLCSVDEHKDHDIVTAAAAKTEKQRELRDFREKIRPRINKKKEDVVKLKYQLNNVRYSADKGVEYIDRSQKELTRLIEKRMNEVKKQIRAKQKAEEYKVKELLGKAQQEIRGLKRKRTELDSLSQTGDHLHFLHKSTSLSTVRDEFDCLQNSKMELSFFNMATSVVKELTDKLQVNEHPDGQRDAPAHTESVPRDELLQYTCDVTLDPRTANGLIYLFSENRRARYANRPQGYRRRPSRFSQCVQVLSKEALNGRSYIEMKLNFADSITVAVAYKNINRKGLEYESGFGREEGSWALCCSCAGATIQYYKKYLKVVTEGPVEKIGMFVDHDAGLLAFYKLNKPKSLIYELRTTFTQPLYLGIGLHHKLDNVEICTPV